VVVREKPTGRVRFIRTFAQTGIQGMNPPGISAQPQRQEKLGERDTYLFLHDLLFLPGNAAATDLQQIERPLASKVSAKILEYDNTWESHL
jgi:hypothetical protein